MGGALHHVEAPLVAVLCARRGDLGHVWAVWQSVVCWPCERAGPFAEWGALGRGDPLRVPPLDRVSYEGKTFSCLITIPGRPPMCVRCRVTGHLRGNSLVGPPLADMLVGWLGWRQTSV